MAEPCVPVRINNLCCPICSDVLRNPVTVPCGHNFCIQCIQDYWDHHNRTECPECGCMFPSRPQLIKNTTLAELVRDTERCDDSKKRKQQDTGASQQVPKRPRSCTEIKTPGSILCGRHNRPLEIYCCTDELILCAICVAEHQGHKFGYMKLERKRKQEELKNMQIKSKQILQQKQKTWKKMRNILEQIQEEARQTEDHCESVVVRVIDSLQRHYLSVRKLIEAQEQVATTNAKVTLQTLKTKIEQLKRTDAQLDCLAQVKSDVCFLQEWRSLRLLCEKEKSFPAALEDPLQPLELTNRHVKELGRRLEEFCDKEFASILKTAGSGDHQESAKEPQEEDTGRGWKTVLWAQDFYSAQVEQVVEPTTRAQFLQYACDLTLDPATAHKDLIVSAGDKEVKLRPPTNKITSICYPQRFMLRRQVLCREGLQAERCYYEIEVTGDKAEIALTYKGIDRKSRTTQSAFGGNANSWSLDRSAVYSVSHKGDSVLLTTSPSKPRIGVYLKFKEGTLSFYEVSDSMKFLYKLEAKFTEPLYPGFWLGERCCIRICDLRHGGL